MFFSDTEDFEYYGGARALDKRISEQDSVVLRNSYIGVKLDKGEYTGPKENRFGDFMMTDIVRFGRPTFKKTNKGEDSFLFFWRNGWYIGKGPKWWNARQVMVRVLDMAMSPLDITESWEVLFSKWNKMEMIWRKLSSVGGLPDTQSIVSSIEDPSLVGGASEATSLLVATSPPPEELEAAKKEVTDAVSALAAAKTAEKAVIAEEPIENPTKKPADKRTLRQELNNRDLGYPAEFILWTNKMSNAQLTTARATEDLKKAQMQLEIKKEQRGEPGKNNVVYTKAHTSTPHGVNLNMGSYKGNWKDMFGDFALNNMVLFGRPTYKQKDPQLDKPYYLFFYRDSWIIRNNAKWWNGPAGRVKVKDNAMSPLDIKTPWEVLYSKWLNQKWVQLSSVGGLSDEQIVSKIEVAE